MDYGFSPEYDDNKQENTIYVGKKHMSDDTDSYRSIELLTSQNGSLLSEKNKENNSKPVDFSILDREVLFLSPKGQFKIFCWLVEDKEGRGISGLRIARRASKGVYGSQEVTLNAKSVLLLKDFLNKLHTIDYSKKEAFKIDVSELSKKDNEVIISNEEFEDIIKSNIKNIDNFYYLVSIEKMELGINKLKEIMNGMYKHETEIQRFLKDNIWMFGNDYAFVAENGTIDSKNILDIMPKNIENYVDIIEVKLPKEQLFNYDKSHNNYYPTSKLTMAISQTQNYIYELEKQMTNDEYKEGKNCKIVRPKGIIIFGSEKDLTSEENEFLRILNSSYHNLIILTYQQLLDKANTTMSFIKGVGRKDLGDI